MNYGKCRSLPIKPEGRSIPFTNKQTKFMTNSRRIFFKDHVFLSFMYQTMTEMWCFHRKNYTVSKYLVVNDVCWLRMYVVLVSAQWYLILVIKFSLPDTIPRSDNMDIFVCHFTSREWGRGLTIYNVCTCMRISKSYKIIQNRNRFHLLHIVYET